MGPASAHFRPYLGYPRFRTQLVWICEINHTPCVFAVRLSFDFLLLSKHATPFRSSVCVFIYIEII